jgi:hypothetical protein
MLIDFRASFVNRCGSKMLKHLADFETANYTFVPNRLRHFPNPNYLAQENPHLKSEFAFSLLSLVLALSALTLAFSSNTQGDTSDGSRCQNGSC